jgi:lycopene cyclase domain-containing protein
MTQWVYLAILVSGLGCMVLMDRRWGLVLWADARRAATVIAAGVVVFLAWDLAALGLGLYRRGESAAMTGVQVAPELPLEEIFFVLFLCYLTLVLHRLAHRLLVSRGATGGGRS